MAHDLTQQQACARPGVVISLLMSSMVGNINHIRQLREAKPLREIAIRIRMHRKKEGFGQDLAVMLMMRLKEAALLVHRSSWRVN